MYGEYLMHLVPLPVMMKWYAGVSQVVDLYTTMDIWQDTQTRLQLLSPMQEMVNRFKSLRDKVNSSSRTKRYVKGRYHVDIVICHCLEPLDWLQDWFARIHEEFGPDVPGFESITVVMYQRCGFKEYDQVFAQLRQYYNTESIKIMLPEPVGYENVCYVHYLSSQPTQNEADYSMFLHGSPQDHMELSLLDDVLRSMSLRTYEIPFLHLNEPRLPISHSSACVSDMWENMIRPLKHDFPSIMQTYCCSQFVVSKPRRNLLSQDLWQGIYTYLTRLSDKAEHLPSSCENGLRESSKLYRHNRRDGQFNAHATIASVVLEH
eukprot:6397188-Amphidinium_carterae.1